MNRTAERRTTGPAPAGQQSLEVKKIHPEFRKSVDQIRPRTLIHRLKYDSQFHRSTVQYVFLLLVVWIGIEFHYFVKWGASNGSTPFIQRPPGVEGFLPISALISLKYFWTTGILNTIHPSGLVILLAICGLGIFMKKSFCSWLCPVGTLSEGLWELGKRLFGRNRTIHRFLDYPLRGLKYLLLAFFLYAVATMDIDALRRFIDSPYNKVADIKMYYFFAAITPFALGVIAVLVALSVVVKNFWCRYLCPYGALLGLGSLMSPMKITRSARTCIDCELCTKFCPSSIHVHRAHRVWSDECTACMKCVQVCPVKNTLEMRMHETGPRISSWVFGILIVGVFTGITGLAMMTGHWRNSISNEEYLRRMQELDKPQYNHFQGNVPEYDDND